MSARSRCCAVCATDVSPPPWIDGRPAHQTLLTAASRSRSTATAESSANRHPRCDTPRRRAIDARAPHRSPSAPPIRSSPGHRWHLRASKLHRGPQIRNLRRPARASPAGIDLPPRAVIPPAHRDEDSRGACMLRSSSPRPRESFTIERPTADPPASSTPRDTDPPDTFRSRSTPSLAPLTAEFECESASHPRRRQPPPDHYPTQAPSPHHNPPPCSATTTPTPPHQPAQLIPFPRCTTHFVN